MDSEIDTERTKKLSDWRKFRCCSICFLITGIFLVLTCAFTPKVMDSLITAAAKKSS